MIATVTAVEVVLVAAATALAAVGGTWIAGRWLQDRDARQRGWAAGRLVYLELSSNYGWVRQFRLGGQRTSSLPFTSSAVWDAVQVDIARVMSPREIGKLVLPYFWLSTIR